MYDNTERLDAAIAKLTPNERADLLRAVDEWLQAHDAPHSLEPLRSALLRARSESSMSCSPDRRRN